MMRCLNHLWAFAALLWVGFASSASLAQVAADKADPITRFAKRSEMIVMRDGVQLYTEIYSPKQTKKPLPILLIRTPYGVSRFGGTPSAFAGELRELVDDGYIFVFQDIRGRHYSQGLFVLAANARDHSDSRAIDEASDTYDTIDWLLQHVGHHNGRVGMLGTSYAGWLAVMAAIDPHPALGAISAQGSPADVYIGDDVFHNGAFRLSYSFESAAMMERGEGNNVFDFGVYDTFDWYRRLGPLTNIEAKYLINDHTSWTDYVAHPTYDTFWESKAIVPRLGQIRIPSLTVGGWYDQEDGYGPLKIFEAWAKGDAGRLNYLTVGPWIHGGWRATQGQKIGQIDFGSPTALYYRRERLAPWFAFYLKDRGNRLPPVQVFQTGANQWSEFDTWPPRNGEPRKLYLQGNGKLSFDAPTSDEAADVDCYVSDPAKPVPYRPRPIESTFASFKGQKTGWGDWLLADQRFVDGRPDVLTWVSDPLDQDISVAGPVTANLFAATTGSDADWVVKLIDVEPDLDPSEPALSGYQLMVTSEIYRARYRQGFGQARALTPNQIEAYRIDLHDRFHRFAKGHRIMIQVQSTWFPLYDRNPQRFVSNIFEARAGDFASATHSIYRSRSHPSHIEITVVP